MAINAHTRTHRSLFPSITTCSGTTTPRALLARTAVIWRLSFLPISGTAFAPVGYHVAPLKATQGMPPWSALTTSSGGIMVTGTRSSPRFIMMPKGRSRRTVWARRILSCSCSSATLGGTFRAAVVPTRKEKPHSLMCCRTHSRPHRNLRMRFLLYCTMQRCQAAFSGDSVRALSCAMTYSSDMPTYVVFSHASRVRDMSSSTYGLGCDNVWAGMRVW